MMTGKHSTYTKLGRWQWRSTRAPQWRGAVPMKTTEQNDMVLARRGSQSGSCLDDDASSDINTPAPQLHLVHHPHAQQPTWNLCCRAPSSCSISGTLWLSRQSVRRPRIGGYKIYSDDDSHSDNDQVSISNSKPIFDMGTVPRYGEALVRVFIINVGAELYCFSLWCGYLGCFPSLNGAHLYHRYLLCEGVRALIQTTKLTSYRSGRFSIPT